MIANVAHIVVTGRPQTLILDLDCTRRLFLTIACSQIATMTLPQCSTDSTCSASGKLPYLKTTEAEADAYADSSLLSSVRHASQKATKCSAISIDVKDPFRTCVPASCCVLLCTLL